VGPILDPTARKRLIDLIVQFGLENVGFRADATRADAKYSKFLKNNSVNISDVNDNEAIATSMRLILDRFDTTFLNLQTALATFNEEYGGESA
jgi:hypothetical protein